MGTNQEGTPLANPPMKSPCGDDGSIGARQKKKQRVAEPGDVERYLLSVLMQKALRTTRHKPGKKPCFIRYGGKMFPVPSLFGTVRGVKRSWRSYVEQFVAHHYGDLALYHLNVEARQQNGQLVSIGSIVLYCRGPTLVESYNWTEKVNVTITDYFEELPPKREFEAAGSKADPKWLLVRLTEFGSPHSVYDLYYACDFFGNLNDRNPCLSNMENTQWVHESETDILTPVNEGDTWAYEMNHWPNASQVKTHRFIWLMARLVECGPTSEAVLRGASFVISMQTKYDVRKRAEYENWKLPSDSQSFRAPDNFLGAF